MRWLGQLSDGRNVCRFNCLMSTKYKITCSLLSIGDHLDKVKSLWIRLEFCIDLSRISVNRDSIRDLTVEFVWTCSSIENPQHCVAVCEFTELECERGSLFKKTTTLQNIMIIMIMRVKNDHRSGFSNLSNWKEEAWKKSGLQRDSNPWPPRCRCVALPTELTAVQLS